MSLVLNHSFENISGSILRKYQKYRGYIDYCVLGLLTINISPEGVTSYSFETSRQSPRHRYIRL